MSGLVSGITKVFSSLGTGVAKLGSAVRGVGATLFTAGAATGTGLKTAATQGGGPLSSLLGGGGVLGNVLSGAIKTGLTGGLVGGAVGAVTGQGFGKGALVGGLGGAVLGGLGGMFSPANAGSGIDPSTTGSIIPADTPTGAAPGIGRYGGGTDSTIGKGFGGKVASTYASAIESTVPGGDPWGGLRSTTGGSTSSVDQGGGGGGGGWKGLGDFLNTNAGSGLLGGIGEAITREREIEALEDMRKADRKFLREKEQRITDSYSVDPSAYVGATGQDTTSRPTPAAKWAYNPNTGMIDMTA